MDLDLELKEEGGVGRGGGRKEGGGGSSVLLAVPAYPPSVIFLFYPKLGGRSLIL